MPNRLAQSQSLYLRKHAENPIAWWPWCAEALEIARREDKPIFLSIGYSSCHWCTVMEGEAFSDGTIAEFMNANFLPIKVDREERPDLDSIYMQTLQMLTGQGGWPLNVFLTPDDLVPFYGGTYFPLEPRYGRPDFLRVLQSIRQYYDTEKTNVAAIKEKILESLQTAALVEPAQMLQPTLLKEGLESNTGVLSYVGPGPSFPMIPYADVVLRASRFRYESRYEAETIANKRGIALALGGIYDHVAGGFHRYTVDPTWTVPHFEKMLYDNGQIVEFLADLGSAGVQEPAFEQAIVGTVQWLKREMTAPEGYFYAAQDADSFTTPAEVEPEEGAFYVWSHQELADLLTSEELAELVEQFTVTSMGNFEGKNVLQRQQPGALSDSLKTALKKLFQVRYGALPEDLPTFPPARNNQEAKNHPWPGRIPAVTDTKLIVAWNSLMISGLARAYAVFGLPEAWHLATQAADFILKRQWITTADGTRRFHRLNYEGQVEVMAQSEDYAFFIKALLDLHQASLRGTGSESTIDWLQSAIVLQAEFDEYLWSLEFGGYYNAASDASSDLLVRERGYFDNATPSANGVAIANLVRLFLLSEDLQYLDRAEQALQTFGGAMTRSPQACPGLFTALDWYCNHTLIRTTPDHLPALVNQYLPTTILKTTTDLPEGTIALVCQGLSCKEPARSLEQLCDQIGESQNRGL
ncbi:MAG: thioredoxin domain-containing protein [Leptolyngbyaceae cyanobacterium bins.59]|nr:thioredoxin domain-containing protein [Leptolyngbyaceae cyanobacterium bins.59]